MKITHNFMDLSKYAVVQQAPSDVIDNTYGEKWYVACEPIGIGQSNPRNAGAWHISDKHLYVPMFPYCALFDSNHYLTGMAVELGFRFAMEAARSRENFRISRLHLSIGVPIELLEDYLTDGDGNLSPCYRLWLGMAISTVD